MSMCAHTCWQVRAIGLSDFSIETIEAVLEVSTIKPMVLQKHFDVFEHDNELLAYCQVHLIATPPVATPPRSNIIS